MYLTYSLLLTCGFLVLVPHFIFQALAHGKYVSGLRQRLGSIDSIKADTRPIIWLHCVSVGETQAARPLVERLLSEFPNYSVVVSTITVTGQNLAHRVFGSSVRNVFYFPFDWTWTAKRSLDAINPSVVLLMETELWPNFLRECKRRDIPVALVNGRISNQSFRRYRIVRLFVRNVLSHLRIAVMQSERDAERIATLGLSREKLFVAGNLKFDANTVSAGDTPTQELQQRFNFTNDRPLILAASTHDPEEKIVIDSFLQLLPNHHVRLMIAPRHPERFQEVAKLLEGSGVNWARRTNSNEANDPTVDAILLDTIGELPAAYSLASIVFVGGSIIKRGGHNVLEPAAAGACVVTGHNTQNFRAIVQLLLEADAIIQLPPLDPNRASACLTHKLDELLKHKEQCRLLGQRAQQVVEANKGTTDRTIALIKDLFSPPGSPTTRVYSGSASLHS
jgi:3-deoxy-D-manno-octulosonic-acid transferase